MPIEPGQQLLHYRIVEKIGEGGMGAVWRGTDTNLNRDVAIKVLPAEVANVPERLTRFDREAKLLATLNHPNIAAVYGFHQAEGTSFLAMELVEGEDLEQRLARGPLSIIDALETAQRIAEGLAAAHDKGVVHRDLKPANVKRAPDGTVKVLDFGLAKSMEAETASDSGSLSMSPTMTSAGTAAGLILGTAGYMSPEQARAKPVDSRADVWAFGVLLWEMLTGRRLFGGETISDIIASVLKTDPDWSDLPPATPPAARRLLERCLQRDPRRRLHHMADARLEIEEALENPEPAEATVAPSSPRKRILAGAAVLVLLLAAAAAGRFLRPAVGPAPLSRLSVTLPDDGIFSAGSYPGRAIDVSRDGRTVVFGTEDGLRIRPLDETETRLLPDTVGAGQPTFSPDGRWIAFFDEHGLKKIPVDGGPAVTILADLPNAPWLQMDWSDDGRIVFDTWNAGLRRVSADGGDPEVLTRPEDEWNLDPQVLPGGEVVLYFAQGAAGDFRIEAIPVDGGEPQPVLDNASHPRYLTSGHLLFMRDGLLMVAPFDRSTLEVVGPAVAVPVDAAKDHVNVAAPLPQLAVSDNGTLVYAPDPNSGADSATLVRVDREGNEVETFDVPLRHPHFSIAPDGSRIAVSGRAGADAFTYILDVERKTLTRLLSEKTDYAAMTVWAPDGSGVYFARYGTHECELWFQPIDGGAPRRLVTQRGTWSSPVSVSADGRYLGYFSYDTETLGRIWYLDLETDAASPVPRELSVEFGLWPAIAPDGRWIAFHSWSDEIRALYVRRFPDGTLEQRVAPESTSEGCWSADGRELFYRSIDDDGTSTIKVVSVTTDPVLRLGTPRELFRGKFQRSADSGLSIAVFPDGESLLLVPEERPYNKARQLIVVQNWFREVEAIARSR